MASRKHISGSSFQQPSTEGTAGVALASDMVICLYPKEGDENKKAIQNYNAWAALYDEKGNPVPDGRMLVSNPTWIEEDTVNGVRGAWKFEVKNLIIQTPGMFWYYVGFYWKDTDAVPLPSQGVRGDMMFVARSNSITIRDQPDKTE